MYKPLPDSVEVRKSTIHGYGLFATTTIKRGTHLGVSHIYAPGFETSYVRTPVGGFINHSDEPNCVKEKKGDRYTLYTLTDVKEGEELTLKYSFYKVK